MSAQPQQNWYTLEEYYALENASDRRWEYWDGDIVCMSGGVEPHGTITANVHTTLDNLFESAGCRAFTDGQAVRAKLTSGYAYPNSSVACNPMFSRHPERGIDILTNPVVITEVTSKDSFIRDHEKKKEAWRINESLRDYLIIEPDAVVITHYLKVGNDWRRLVYSDLDDKIELVSGVTLPISRIYRDVKFDA